MSRTLRILAVLSLCLQTLSFLAHPTSVYADAAPDIDDYLAEFADKLDTLGFLEELGAELPFTSITPSDREALDLTHLFGDTLGDAMRAGSSTLSELKTAIAGAGASWSLSDMEVTYGGVSVEGDGIVAVTFSMTATHDTALPIGYFTDTLPLTEGITVPLDLEGGEMDVRFQLSTTLGFQFDPDLYGDGEPDLAFTLAGEPVMDIGITASGPITPFRDLLGFTDIDVTGAVTLSEKIAIQLVDPDGLAPFTWQEWTQTAIEDLASIAFQESEGTDVEGILTLDSGLVGCDTDASVTLTIADLSIYAPPGNPLPDPQITLCEDMKKFANVAPNDVLAGLGQFAIAIGAAQITNDVELPYLRHPLSAGFEPGRALFELAKQQGDAFIMCGPADTIPPTGDPTAGGTIYCQTFAPTDPISVTWSIQDDADCLPSCSIDGNPLALETVGVRPTENVTFSDLPAGELPPIQVKFRDPPGTDGTPGVVHSVTPRVRSAQELLEELEDLATVTSAALQFDQATASLTYSVTMEWEPDAVETSLAFGDQLRQAANLSGLTATNAASASFDVDGASLAATFGVILVDDVADITPVDPDAKIDDRFFLKVNPNDVEFQAEDLSTDVTIDLAGRIGYLEVAAEGDGTANPHPDDNLEYQIVPIDDDLPILAVDILPPESGIPISGTEAILDAVLVRSLLLDTRSYVSQTVNLRMSAGLWVSGTLSPGESLQGTMGIRWDDMSSGQPLVTPDTAFRTTLQRFDVVPTVTGFHDGSDDATALTDTTRGITLPAFPDSFGLTVTAGDHMTTMLHNLTDGSSCTSFFVTTDNSLTCAEFDAGSPVASSLKGGYGFEGGEDAELTTGTCSDGQDNDEDGLTDGADPDCDFNDWDGGDQYLIPGDPQALGTVVLQNLYDLAARMSTVTTDTWSTSEALPMVGLSPKELVPQFAEVTQAIADINAGQSAVEIDCLSSDTGADLVQSAPQITETVYCSATVPISTAVAAVSWTVVNSTTISNETMTETVGTQVASPTEAMAFTTDDFTGLQVTVEVTDGEGIVRRGHLPQGPPLSLADLELDLESALGIEPGDLTFTLTDLYNPTADDTLKHLVLNLALAGGGERDVRLRMDLPGVEDPNSSTPGSCSDGVDNGADGKADDKDTDCADPLQVIADEPSDTLPLQYNSQVTLALGIPLSSTIAPSNTVILDSTGARLSAELETSTAVFSATLGALSVRLGAGLVITGTHTEDAVIGGIHTDPISSTTTLTDTFHTNHDGLKFDELPIRVGVPLSNTTDGTTCNVGTVGEDILICNAPLSSGQWDQNDIYTVVGPSATTLHDPSRDFTEWGIEAGDTLRNETDGVECTITTVNEHELICDGGLPDNHRWHEGDEYRIATAGLVKFDADFELGNSDPGPLALEDFITGLTATLSGLESNDCGVVAEGDVCARLGVAVVQSPPQPVGSLSFWMTDVGDADTTGGTIPGALAELAAKQQLEWSILSLALPEMRFILEDNLDGAYWNQQLPLVGDDLAAGAVFDDPVLALGIAIQDGIDDLADAIEDGTVISATELVGELQGIVWDAIEEVAAISPTVASSAEVIVEVTCSGGAECDDSYELGDVDSVEVKFAVGHNLNGSSDLPQQGCDGNTCGGQTADVPFGIGLPGLPLTSDDNLTSRVGWHLDIGFGLSRTLGPYLLVGDPDELVLGAKVTMPVGGDCEEDYKLDSVGLWFTEVDEFGGTFADGEEERELRCIDGFIGFLEGSMYDGHGDGNEFGPDDDSTYVSLRTKLNIRSGTNKLTFGQLMDGTSGHEVKVEAEANIDLSFSTGYGDRGLGFPPIVGTVHMSYDLSPLTEITQIGEEEWVDQPYYKNLYLDATLFFGEFIAAMVEEVQTYTKPFQPVIDVITTPIPVISDLSEAVGGEPVTLLSLLEAISGNDLSMVERIADFITFFNNIPADKTNAFLLGLGPSTGEILQAEPGEFAVMTSTVIEPNCGEDGTEGDSQDAGSCSQPPALGSAGKQWERFDLPTVRYGSLAELFLGETRDAAGGASSADPGISYPFLNDTTEIFGMLLGEDADILYVNLGSFKASAGVSWTFGPFFAGPVPLNISIGGSVTIKGRFAIGFDTRGLRSYMAGGSLVDVLIDGIYLDDYDLQGNEVPEVELILEFWAGASVGFYIFEAGLEAGATFTISLDLNDPNNDGKMYIDEILFWRFNPICLFVVRGTLEFFLKVYLEIDLFLFSKRFEWELYRTKPPIELFEIKCEPPVPKFAEAATRDVDGDGNNESGYWLNMGPHKAKRNIFTDEDKEKYFVRQLTAEGQGCAGGAKQSSCAGTGTWISITFQGILREYLVPSGMILYGHAGDLDDVIKLLPGGEEEELIEFTLDAKINLGSGNDEITAGKGDDTVWGGEGNDKIYVEAGNDTVYAGEGSDIVEGKTGEDVIDGGGGDDTLLNGGPGKDLVYGGEGNDIVNGGPGLPPDLELAGSQDITPYKDFGDILVGGNGDDDLDGGFGEDWVFGDNLQGHDGSPDRDTLANPAAHISLSLDGACHPDGSGTGQDQVTGGDHNDHLFGGDGHDLLTGGDGDDYMCGNGGNDRLDGEDGEDRLFGGNDDDALYGREGHDQLFGGAQRDLLWGGEDDDDLVGCEGSDALLGEWGHDILLGDGDETSIGDHTAAQHPSEKDAVLAAVNLGAVAGNGTINCTRWVEIIDGWVDLNNDGDIDSDDTGLLEGYSVVDGWVDLDLNSTREVSDTGTINDTVILEGLADLDGNGTANDDGYLEGVAAIGSGNADCLYGDVGNDYLFGGPGDDQMRGEDDVDYMQGNDDDDWMRGGKADDEMYGNGGSDEMYGDEGQDRMFGGTYHVDGDPGYADSGDYMYGNAGLDIMLGDNGNIISESPDVIQTSDPVNGGDDWMYGNGVGDIILGGSGGDHIWGNTGEDVILGDNGVVTRTAEAQVAEIRTTYPDYGGSDTIEGNQAKDIILGGSGEDGDEADGGDYDQEDVGDSIEGNEDQDIILGDNGYISFVEESGEYVVARIETNVTDKGGDDTIFGDIVANAEDADEDIILGGNADDVITGNEADDTILGDNGVVVLAPDPEDGTDVYSTAPEDGGSDTIHGNDGYDLILGGSGGSDLGEGNLGDTITGDDGEDIILGDSGYVTRTEEYSVTRIATMYPCLGAGDIISGNQMKDIILGGNADDSITGDGAEDTILGDNGVVVRTDGSEQENDIYTTDPDCGGADTIAGNEGNDLILGGSGGTDLDGVGGGDTITGNEGEDIILGDNGYITRDADDVVEHATTTYQGYGGEDTIEGNTGDDMILGGADGDDLRGNEEDDILLGDNGAFYYDLYGDLSSLDHVTTISPTIGGTDTISGNAGIDLVFGGTVSDTISGNEDHDILLGDHGLWDSTRPVDQPFLSIDTAEADLGGQDIIHGNEGDDFILGGQEGDFLYGDLDQDDMTGGHNVPAGADGDDKMYGDREDDTDGTADGSHGDVMIGDNGIITRTMLAATWLYQEWVPNTFNDTVARVIELYDVEWVDDQVDASLYGDDDMYGNDNDDIMYGQNGEDEMYGGAGDDYMEGNADSDYMEGDGEDDDMLGGSGPYISFDFSTECVGCTDESSQVREVPFGELISDTAGVPLGDVMYGDAGSDVMLGDNGVISRPLDIDGYWTILDYSLFQDTIGGAVPRHPISGTAQRVDREVWMVDEAFGRTSGSDYMEGGSGDDDMYGQYDDTAKLPEDLPLLASDSYSQTIGDELLGNGGEDAMAGDQAVIDNWVVVSPTQWIEPPEPFIDDHIYVQGTLFREVELDEPYELGGNDRMKGNEDGDWMHGGAGDDLMIGNSGNDRMHGDDDDDVMWGGPHHDHLWGGYGDDYLDVRPRLDDPAQWHAYATEDHYQDVDYVYGGWDQDALQANVGDEGPEIGDRLIDWVGAYNVYYLCPGLYGEFVATRDLSPHMIAFLQELSQADGAVETKTPGSSGFDEVAMVFPNEAGQNASPVHPDNPGHFVCGEAFITPTVRSLAIELSATTKKDQAQVSAEVKVVYEYEGYDEVAPGATVEITWTKPGGLAEVQIETTSKKGVAKFSTVGASGFYTLTISDIYFEGYDFDRDRSQLTAWIDTVSGLTGLGAPPDVHLPERIYLPLIVRQ